MATTSATATIIQAAEHVVIEEATTVAKALTKKNAAEIKSIVNGVAKETVAASDDSVSTIIQNIEDGAKVVGSEIVKGAEAVVEAVEKHPELIAEGALAVGIGIASVVQPELIVGSVALIGKMATDAAKETINEIVVESGTGVVKGVSKEITEETAQLAAEDAAIKAKEAALGSANDGGKPGTEATVEVKSAGNVSTEIVATQAKDGEAAGTKVLTTISGDATAVVREVTPGNEPGPIISSETVQTSATSTSEIQGNTKPVTSSGPSVLVTTNDLTGDKTAVVQQGAVTTVVKQPAVAKDSDEAKQIAVANVDVKALAKEVALEMSELEAAKTSQNGVKTIETVSTEATKTISNISLKSAAAKLEADLKKSAEKAEQEGPAIVDVPEPVEPVPVEENEIGSSPKPSSEATALPDTQAPAVEEPQAEVDEETPSLEVEKKSPVAEDVPILTQLGLVHADTPSASIVQQESKPHNKVEAPTDHAEMDSPQLKPQEEQEDLKKAQVPEETDLPNKTTIKSEVHKETSENIIIAKAADVSSDIEITKPNKESPIVALDTEAALAPLAAIRDTAAHALTHAAVLEAHDKIAKLHKSNELLHQKLDTMQEALLAITRALAERPSPTPPTPVIAEGEAEPIATENNQVVLASASEPAAESTAVIKRMSVFGSIGWLFGAGSGSGSSKKGHKRGKSVATSTPATVTGEFEGSGEV